MRSVREYRNYSARARRQAWLLDRAFLPLAWFRPPTPLPAARPDQRILVARADHLGDLLMATPALAALRKARPQARIDVLASPWGAPALAGNPDVDQVLTFPATWYEAAREGTLRRADIRRTVRELRAGRYDIGVDLRGDPRILMLLRRGGMRCLVGFSALGLERLLSASLPLDPSCDHRRRNLAVVELLGADPAQAPEQPVFRIEDSEREEAAGTLAPAPRPWILVAPGSNRRRNTWGSERFAAAADALARETGGTIVLIGRDADAWATDAVRQAMQAEPRDLTGATSLTQLAALLAAGDLLLANDSGALHLAAAAGCPVVALFGATSSDLTFPYPEKAGIALSGPTPCPRPCFRRDCREDHGYAEITPDAVTATALSLLRP